MELDLSPLALPGVDSTRPIVIAGPCSAETEEQVLTTARQLFKNGIKIFRAGIWKPRTKPGGFEGVGEVGLPWLAHVKEELGMLTSTEVATPAHVEAALQHGIDLLWIGARTVVNPFAMQELADALRGVDIPVLVKNPVNPDLELWIGGLQRLNDAGVRDSVPFIVASRATTSASTAILRSGTFPSSCADAFPTFLFLVIPRTPVAAGNSSPHSANKPWIWATTGSSSRAIAAPIRRGAMRRNR